MPRDSVDTLIEDMFGFGPTKTTKPGQKSPPKAPKAPNKGNQSASLEEAARAVFEALRAHKGKVRSVKSWRKVAAGALGAKRLPESRWQAVLSKGVEAGLFTIDESTYSYPVLVPSVQPQPENETGPPLANESPAQEAGGDGDDQSLSSGLPEGWVPPEVMDCGHFSWYWKEDQEDGKVKCLACKKRYVPMWEHLRGKFRRPVPLPWRRTAEKVRTGGYPGLCCDSEGYYIGGTINDCRKENPKKPDKWCQYHREQWQEQNRKRRERRKTTSAG